MLPVVAAVLAGLAQVPDEVRQSAIDAARAAIVTDIDPGLEPVTLEVWLSDLAGNPEIAREVNDCGEQTGDPALDGSRDSPMCVDGRITLDGARTLTVSLVVGSWETGVDGPPVFWGAYVREGTGEPQLFDTFGQTISAVRND
jgi:hypothetical protein